MSFNEKIVDISTGNEIIKPYDEKQIAEYEIAKMKKIEKENQIITKDTARQAVLDKLGLTADEVAALLG